MKTALVAAVSAVLFGTAYAADDAVDSRAATDRSVSEVSAFEPLPGTERGPLNNGQLSTRDSYGHILSDPDLFDGRATAAADTEEASAIEISQFEVHPGTERGPLNNGQFDNRDMYGYILSDPALFEAGQAVAADTEEASAIEISQFEEHPGIERGPLNNGQLDNRDSYGHILSDPKLFENY